MATAKALLHDWRADLLASSVHKEDPLDTVMAEGGPFHVRDDGPAYIERLKNTGRTIAERFESRPRPYRED